MMEPRTDWTGEEIASLFDLRFTEPAFRAAEVHRANHSANEVQLSTLLSIKTGGCVEDCGYCSQSVKALVPIERTVLGDMLAEAPLAKIDDIEFVAPSRLPVPPCRSRWRGFRRDASPCP
jgi:biotin synthase-like enzyme